MARREWHGTVYLPAGRTLLHLRIRVAGRWRSQATPYTDTPEGHRSADRMLSALRTRLQAEEAAAGPAPGPLTVERWADTWLKTRRDRYDGIHLRVHVLPVVGHLLLRELEPRHLLDLVQAWIAAGAPPRTIRNRYSTIRALCRDAAVRGLIPQTPAILASPAHLPAIEDADPEWRSGAILSRAEWEALVMAEGVAPDQAAAWSILALAGLRHGELAALRWRHYDAGREPLGSLLVARSGGKARTKTGKSREVPVLPLLASRLASWRLRGWEAMHGRPPGPDDLLVPRPPWRGRPGLERRRVQSSDLRRLHSWLAARGWRDRRTHDLRRTWVTLCQTDGADHDVLGWASHGRPADVMGLYTEMDWSRLCGEVGKLKVPSVVRGKVVDLKGRKTHEN